MDTTDTDTTDTRPFRCCGNPDADCEACQAESDRSDKDDRGNEQ